MNYTQIVPKDFPMEQLFFNFSFFSHILFLFFLVSSVWDLTSYFQKFYHVSHIENLWINV